MPFVINLSFPTVRIPRLSAEMISAEKNSTARQQTPFASVTRKIRYKAFTILSPETAPTSAKNSGTTFPLGNDLMMSLERYADSEIYAFSEFLAAKENELRELADQLHENMDEISI